VAGIAWALALGAREDGSSLVPVLDPVSNWGVQALSPTVGASTGHKGAPLRDSQEGSSHA
jgi:hypothetical protein